ncbi:PspC domain-containing protein [Microbacterium sp. RD1]|uniref:PspC domain-containing protein n=1 Tax=Microbacterium sp. RD1 TaxID=3457313 RepID=UPI003FA5D8BD
MTTPTFADAPARGSTLAPPRERPRLLRPRAMLITGVSAGLAHHLGWRVSVVRWLFVLTSLLWGAGVLLYLWLWAFVPLADASDSDSDASGAAPTRRAPAAWMLTALAVLALAITLISVWTPRGEVFSVSALARAAGGVVVVTGLALAAGLWATLLDGRDPARGPRHATAVRAVLTGVLVVLAVVVV